MESMSFMLSAMLSTKSCYFRKSPLIGTRVNFSLFFKREIPLNITERVVSREVEIIPLIFEVLVSSLISASPKSRMSLRRQPGVDAVVV